MVAIEINIQELNSVSTLEWKYFVQGVLSTHALYPYPENAAFCEKGWQAFTNLVAHCKEYEQIMFHM